ncbi:MAG: hypothetical protein JRI36_14280 [Deltaproteobacteria bacterium]|nr:hypothetical protein [Deltaproteobacteria bacterium]
MKTVGVGIITMVTAVGMLTSLLVSPALAGPIGQRQIAQQKRIFQGVAEDELTWQEYRQLQREQCRIQKSKQCAWRDGTLSPKERLRLRCRQNRASRHIFVKKHNNIAP